MQEVSRVGVHGLTSKSKLLALEMPALHTGGLRVDSGVARWLKGARARQRVDRSGSYASSGPGWKMQEVSRVGAQEVTSKSKLLAREVKCQTCTLEACGPIPARRGHGRVRVRGRGSIEDDHMPSCDLDGRYRR